MKHTYKMGEELKDKISGFKGIVVGITEYFNGCVQYCLKPQKLNKEGAMQDSLWLDQQHLERVGPGLSASRTAAPVGGPDSKRRIGEK